MIRLLFFDIPHDKRKCGAAAAIGSGVSGLAGGLITSHSSNKIANKQIAAQQRENELNRAYQTAEAEKARQFNTSEREASQEFSREQMAWQEKMVQQQNEYNSPVNQARMLSEAGLNPAIAMQGQGTTVSASPGNPASTGAQASSPMPSPVGGLSPVSQQPLDLQIPQLANGIASLLTGVANAKKAGVETGLLEQAIPDSLRKLKADASVAEVSTALLELDKNVRSQTLKPTVEKAWSEAEKAVYDAIISFNTVGKVQNESEYYSALTNLQKALTSQADAQTKLFGLEVSSFIPKLDAYLGLVRSETAEHYAGAKAKESQVGLNESLSKLLDIKSDIEHLNWSENKFTLFGRVVNVFNELKHQGLINKQLQNEVDNQLGKQFLDGAEQGLNILSKLINIVTSAGK